jgi:hypothetical protein
VIHAEVLREKVLAQWKKMRNNVQPTRPATPRPMRPQYSFLELPAAQAAAQAASSLFPNLQE